MKLGYTTILHEPRLALGLSCNEYCLADMVYNLSTNPKAPVRGWCSASQPMLGGALGISRQSINTMIKKLALRAILIKSESGKLLKCGELWIDTVVSFNFNSKETLQGVKKVDSQESLHHVKKVDSQQSRKFTVSSQESLHNKYIDTNSDNNINKNSVDKSPPTPTKKEIKPKIKKVAATTSIGETLTKQSINIVKFKAVMAYLIEKTGKAFKIADTEAKIKRSDKFKKINARLVDGYAVEDFKAVIDTKCREWLESPKMSKYLQPSTLFCLKNFEKYLDESQNNSNHEQTQPQQLDRSHRNGARTSQKFRNGVDQFLKSYSQAISFENLDLDELAAD